MYFSINSGDSSSMLLRKNTVLQSNSIGIAERNGVRLIVRLFLKNSLTINLTNSLTSRNQTK